MIVGTTLPLIEEEQHVKISGRGNSRIETIENIRGWGKKKKK